MRKLSILLSVIVLFLAGCKNKQTSQADSSIEETATSTSTEVLHDTSSEKSFLLTQTELPETIDMDMDISRLSLQELRILRHYPYALHGMHFMEADMHAFFSANTTWYEKRVYDLYNKDEDLVPLDYKEVSLNRKERAFVERIDKRIAELKKDDYHLSDNHKLANPANVVNLFQFNEYDDEFMEKLLRNNFVITPGNNIQLFHLYEENDYRRIPNFITTDLFLQAFHMFFSYTLKSLEQEQFVPILTELCKTFYNESLKVAKTESDPAIKAIAEFNTAFYAIPYYFLAGEYLPVPKQFERGYHTEIMNIKKEEDDFSEFMSFTHAYFPYSLFKARGNYTRKPKMQGYFKAMMWLQTAPFCRDNGEHLKQAIFSALLLNNSETEQYVRLKELYTSVYEPLVFLVGLPDNLSMMDIADYLVKESITDLHVALSSQSVKNIDEMLIELGKDRNEIRPQIELSCRDKINIMPQRYLIDNDVLQNMVDITPSAKRAYPKGVDAFAAFGSQPATQVLNHFYNEKRNWEEYPERMDKMKEKFNAYDQWDASIYNKWIYSLLELQKTDKSYPEFMNTKAWSYKNLNTSLASWAELKHDVVLYGEQPAAAECGGGGLPDPIVRGYVEPNLKFWKQLAEMVVLTKDMLEKHKLLTPDLQGKIVQLSEYTDFLIKATETQLAGEVLSDNEYYSIEYMGSSIEYFTLSVIDPDLYLDNWSLVKGPDKSIATVTDIYTRNIQECDKNGVLHAATGNANTIYVVVEIAGNFYLTRGATFSYYEFVQPLGTRLTDEEWQQMLKDGEAPAIPAWMDELFIKQEPRVDDRIFYSSGC